MNHNIILTIIFVSLIIYSVNNRAENRDTTYNKISQRLVLIKDASKKFDINYKILCSVIYTERTLNYTWEDDALDIILADGELNSSIGFCQVKMKTAYWIELQLKDTSSKYYCGGKYKNILKVSKSPGEIIKKLTIDSLNILYAAAYIKIMEQRWLRAGYSIDKKPAIIGTLYSTGIFYGTGEERRPRRNAKSNRFGRMVLDSIKLFR